MKRSGVPSSTKRNVAFSKNNFACPRGDQSEVTLDKFLIDRPHPAMRHWATSNFDSVPEPATLTLIGAGVSALVIRLPNIRLTPMGPSDGAAVAIVRGFAR